MEKSTQTKNTSSIATSLTLWYIALTIINIGIFWVGSGSNQMRLISEKAIASARSIAFESLRRLQPLSEQLGHSAYPIEEFKKSIPRFKELLKKGKPQDLLSSGRVLTSGAELLFMWPELPGGERKPGAKEILDSLKAIQLREVKNELFIGIPDLGRREIDLFIPIAESIVLTTKLPLPDVGTEIAAMIRLGVGMILLLLLLQSGMGYLIYRKFVMPIQNVSKATMNIADGDFIQIQNDRKKNDEINQLIDSFNAMSSELKRNKEMMQLELDIARKIQMAILPRTIETGILTAYIHYNPLQTVSGDYYDFLELADGSIACFIGDASGHGVPAAFITIMAKVYFTSLVEKKDSPAQVLSAMNQLMSSYFGGSGLYLTAFYMRIYPDGRAVYCNAMHPDVILLRKTGETELLKPTGFYVGMMKKVFREYQDVEIRMHMGDKLVLYTDGLTEAINSGNVAYSPQRFIATAEQNRFETADSLVQNTVNDVATHQGAIKREDDETLIVVEIGEVKQSIKAPDLEEIFSGLPYSLTEIQKKFPTGYAEASEIAARSPSPQNLLEHAKACLKARLYGKALPALALLMQSLPGRKSIIFHFAFSLYGLGDIAACRSVITSLLREHGDFADAHWLMSLCALKAGDKAYALTSIQYAIAKKPEDVRFRKVLHHLS